VLVLVQFRLDVEEPETEQGVGAKGCRLVKEQLGLVEKMEKLLLEETEPGWDWKKGLEGQEKVRKQQFAGAKKLGD
jgi:hypothetical protein